MATAVKQAAPTVAEEGLRSFADALPFLGEKTALVLKDALHPFQRAAEVGNENILVLSNTMPKLGIEAARMLHEGTAREGKAIRVEIGHIRYELAAWREMIRIWMPYILGTIIIYALLGVLQIGGSMLSIIIPSAILLLVVYIGQNTVRRIEQENKGRLNAEQALLQEKARREELDEDVNKYKKEIEGLVDDKDALEDEVDLFKGKIKALQIEIGDTQNQLGQQHQLTMSCYLLSRPWGKYVMVHPDHSLSSSPRKGPWETLTFELIARDSNANILIKVKTHFGGYLDSTVGGRLVVEKDRDAADAFTLAPSEEGSFQLTSVRTQKTIQMNDRFEVRLTHRTEAWETFRIELAGLPSLPR